MKAILEHLPKKAEESFVVCNFNYSYFPTPWHFHPEYELVLVIESTGKRIIGNNISNFDKGNLALLGPYLPHQYRNDQKYYDEQSTLRAKSIVIHFTETTFGENFFNIPETKKIKQLLSRSFQGIELTGSANLEIAEKMEKIINMHGFERLLLLLEVLHIMSEANVTYISTENYYDFNSKEYDRMNKVIDFVFNNFALDITLHDAAVLANMTDNSFSRYFSQRTRKSFTRYVNEIRLSHASKLLIESNNSIAQICYECGFNNLSNFNRQFKSYFKLNPLNYRKTFLDL